MELIAQCIAYARVEHLAYIDLFNALFPYKV